MDLALQLLFTGIGIGAVYALVALGFVLIFRATNVVNFAQGAFSMVAAYLMVVTIENLPCAKFSTLVARKISTKPSARRILDGRRLSDGGVRRRSGLALLDF